MNNNATHKKLLSSLGDLNTKIVDKFELRSRNEYTGKLVQWFIANDQIITNTWFQGSMNAKKLRRKCKLLHSKKDSRMQLYALKPIRVAITRATFFMLLKRHKSISP